MATILRKKIENVVTGVKIYAPVFEQKFSKHAIVASSSADADGAMLYMLVAVTNDAILQLYVHK